jgi:hypothetical protein
MAFQVPAESHHESGLRTVQGNYRMYYSATIPILIQMSNTVQHAGFRIRIRIRIQIRMDPH